MNRALSGLRGFRTVGCKVYKLGVVCDMNGS